MSEEALLSTFPAELINRLIWSENLDLIDRLRCQEVCKQWRKALQLSSKADRKRTVPDLVIDFTRFVYQQQQPAIQLDQVPATAFITPTMEWALPVSSESYLARCRWFTAKAHLIQTIQLRLENRVINEFRHFCEVLQAASLRSSNVLEVIMDADDNKLQQCGCLLSNSLVHLDFYVDGPELQLQNISNMTRLTYLNLDFQMSKDCSICAGSGLTLLESLPWLHTLELQCLQSVGAELCIPALPSLRNISLMGCCISSCDLSSCTQVTSLDWDIGVPERLQLPIGLHVQLQSINIMSPTYSDGFLELIGLQAATQLTSIELFNTYPGNFNHEAAWPAFMPHLQAIRIDDWQLRSPRQLVGYSSLRHLHLGCHPHTRQPVILPDWLSQLTQLQTFSACGLSEFPACLLQLRQLCSLDVSLDDDLCIALPEVSRFSHFTGLTRLEMDTSPWEQRAADSGLQPF